MTRQATNRGTSEDDLFLHPWVTEDIGQAEERQVDVGALRDSRVSSSFIVPVGSTVGTSSADMTLAVGDLPDERRRVDFIARSWPVVDLGQVEVESDAPKRIRALYETVADVFEKDVEIADLLQVPEEEVREWKRGTASDAEALDRLENLSAAVSKLRAIYDSEVIPDWLQGLNAHLGGARPVDVLLRGQLSRVIAAIEAERGGAHA